MCTLWQHCGSIVAALLDPVQTLSLKGGLGLDQNQINLVKNSLLKYMLKHGSFVVAIDGNGQHPVKKACTEKIPAMCNLYMMPIDDSDDDGETIE